MLKPLAIWIVFIIMSELGDASTLLPDDCKSLPINEEDCLAVKNDNSMSIQEKKEIIANLLVDLDGRLNHDLLLNYVNKITFDASNPPNGAPRKNGSATPQLIKNAWVKILGIYPSVKDLEENAWFVHNKGVVKIVKGYVPIEPPTIAMPNCSLINKSKKDSEELENSINGKRIENQEIAKFGENDIMPGNLEFKSEYTVKRKITYTFLCGSGKNKKTVTKEYEDVAKLEDNYSAKYRPFGYKYGFTIEDTNGLRRGLTGFSSDEPVRNVTAGSGDATISYGNSINDIFWDLEPYDILHFSRKKIGHKEFKGTVNLDFGKKDPDMNFIYLFGSADKSNACILRIENDFNEIILDSDCNQNIMPKTILEMKADKKNYPKLEPVKLTIAAKNEFGNPLANKIIPLKTPEKVLLAETDEKGIANISLEPQTIDISADGIVEQTFYGSSAETSVKIDVDNSDKFETAKVISGLVLSYYLLFLILKKVVKVKI